MRLLYAVIAICVATAASAQTRQASLGECPLELGGRIENCRIGYRTFGTLDAQKQNAVLIPTWFAGRAEAWAPLLGPAGVVDTTGFYVVVVESLGAGSSSSPSNSPTQAGYAFPEITIGDMVEASYRLARDHLGLSELYAVVGHSMGALQAFEWGVAHPDYVRRIVPIHGNPRQAIYGRAMWELIVRTAERGLSSSHSDSTARDLARFFVLAATSPAAANRRPDSTYSRYMDTQAEQLRTADLYEWVWHGRAMLRHDVARNHGGSLSDAARRWRARTLVVAATQDHSLDSEPARAFAQMIRADTLILESAAGHSAVFADSTVKAFVRQWLKR